MKKKGIVALSFIATLAISSVFASTQVKVSEESKLSALAKFTKVLGSVEQYYVDEVTFNEIITKSIDGLLNNLDAHSSFLDEKKFKDMKVQTDGEFGGLGITIGMKNGGLTIIAPIEGTPADKAGLKSGDIILRINEASTLNMTIDEAVGLMRGKPKTDITLNIVREGELKPLTFNITRDIIKINSVYTKTIEDEKLLYLRVTSFDKNVVDKTKEAIAKNRDVEGIILDMRNNPGGLLDQAIGLTDLFVSEGVIVSQKGRIEGEDKEFKATKKATITEIPMTVLINSGSASASEIVAGALQDHKRGVVIGETTFGKGSVQVILPINKEEAIKLTIARYYLPSGRTIQATGVTPDVLVYPGKVPTRENDFSIKENDLKLHLTSELAKLDDSKDKKEEKKSKDDTIITQKMLQEDIQLKSAVDIVKALIITKK